MSRPTNSVVGRETFSFMIHSFSQRGFDCPENVGFRFLSLRQRLKSCYSLLGGRPHMFRGFGEQSSEWLWGRSASILRDLFSYRLVFSKAVHSVNLVHSFELLRQGHFRKQGVVHFESHSLCDRFPIRLAMQTPWVRAFTS